MSHFMVGVIVHKGTDEQVLAEVERLMAPFDEGLEVDPRDEKCHCVNRIARKAGYDAAEAVKKLEQYRNDFRGLYPNFVTDEVWKEYIKPYTDLQEKVEREHPAYEKPLADCEDCKGTGLEKVRYNPNSHWDWFVVGGRWDGAIQNKPREDGKGGFNFGDEHHQVKNNSISVEDMTDAVKRVTKVLEGGVDCCIPFALVTPDGAWHEKGRMGWFGMSANEKEDNVWEKQVMDLLEANPECLVIGVDCHV